MHWWSVLPLQNRLTRTRGRHWVVFSCGNTLPCSSHATLDRNWVGSIFRLSCLRHFHSWLLGQLQTFPLGIYWSVRVEWRGVTPRLVRHCSCSSVCRLPPSAHTLSLLVLLRSNFARGIFQEGKSETYHQVNLSSGQVPENVITHWLKRSSATVRVHFLQSLLLIFAHVFASEMCRLI